VINRFDIVYGAGVLLSSPYWLAKPRMRRKVLRAFRERTGNVAPRDPGRPAVMIHAVSLGEVNAARALVEMLQRGRPDLHVILSTTTDTGYARARQLYGWSPDVSVIRYPLDFTKAVNRVLARLRPQLVVLMELEVWPNFILQCERLGIPVALVNGRVTETSFRRYDALPSIILPTFGRLARICAQDQVYASRFIELGASPSRVQVTGTMKFDTAQVSDRIEGDERLANALGIRRGLEMVWVCGSTGPGEEEILLRVHRQLLNRFARLRLVIVPRKPERFDEVAELIERFHFKVLRRSRNEPPPVDPPVPPIILGDTMGELRKFYSLSDVVFVGRTLVDLGARQHGSDMIEPAALAKPVLVGPHTGNFAEAMIKFRQADAVMEVADEAALGEAIRVLLSTPEQAGAMGRRAQDVVRREQGATARNAQVILELLDPALSRAR
jgi:3-deoxy-D-manno-octulosonic-acid transferase